MTSIIITVKINEISITPTAPGVDTIGENYTLQCAVYLLQPNSLPESVSSLLWIHSLPNSAFPTYETDVYVYNPKVAADGTAYYTQLLSTVQFSPLQASHAGTVSCQVEDDEILAANISIIVNGIYVLIKILYASIYCRIIEIFHVYSSSSRNLC